MGWNFSHPYLTCNGDLAKATLKLGYCLVIISLKFMTISVCICLIYRKLQAPRRKCQISHEISPKLSMAKCKTAVSPLLTHWSYCSLVQSHRNWHAWYGIRCEPVYFTAMNCTELRYFPISIHLSLCVHERNIFKRTYTYAHHQWCRPNSGVNNTSWRQVKKYIELIAKAPSGLFRPRCHMPGDIFIAIIIHSTKANA